MTDVASFDPVKAEEILREVVTPETWRDISRKVAREKLEEKLGESEGGSESDDEAEPASKKQKTGAGPPKNLKKLQSAIMSRQSFLEQAPVMASKIGEMVFDMKPRTFSSGSCGWFHGGKVAIKVGDQELWCQLGVNCTGKQQMRFSSLNVSPSAI
ncbi:hypothetical protein Emed_000256 [Eimeria media]